MKKHLSIRLLLMIVLPLFISVVMLLLALSASNRAREVVIDVQEEDMQQIVELAGSSINRLWIAPRVHAVTALSRSDTLAQHLAAGGRNDELFREWAAARSVMEGTFFIYYALEDGTILHYPPEPLPEGFDPRTRPWYKAGIASRGSAVWSPPYQEIITGTTLVSVVIPIADETGRRIGVFSTDVIVEAVAASLAGIQLPAGGEVFLLDQEGTPFVGTDTDIVETGSLPAPSEALFVDVGRPLSSGWRVAMVVPRQSLTNRFVRVRQPMILSFALVVGLSAVAISWIVGSLVSRTRRLATYFDEVMHGATEIRAVFRTRDEFHFLNEQFNKVILNARQVEEQRLSQERFFRLLVERAPIGFFRTRRDGSVIYTNNHLAQLLGHSREELARLPSIGLLYRDREDRKNFLSELESNQEVRDRRIQYVHRSGAVVWLSVNAFLTPPTEEDSQRHIEGFVVDVTADMAERESLKRLSETDPLTGVANRRAFNAAAERFMERDVPTGEPVGLILFDIDHFKDLNDTLGHELGDSTLRTVAAIGVQTLRRSDLIARIGGDEFAILLPGATEDDTYNLGEKLKKEVEVAKRPVGLQEPLTISVGVGSYIGGKTTVREMIRSTDNALYAAKYAGRNCVRRVSQCCT